MITIYSPSNIEVLLHCRICPLPHPRSDAPAVQEAIAEFLRIGAIEHEHVENKEYYRTTPMGKAWVAALCNVPPPRSVFVDEQGRVLE